MRWKSNAMLPAVCVRARPCWAPLHVLHTGARKSEEISQHDLHSMITLAYLMISNRVRQLSVPFTFAVNVFSRHGAVGNSSCDPWRRIAAKARGTKRRGKSVSTSWSSGVVPNHMAT